MSQIDINSVLSQIRSIRAELNPGALGTPATGKTGTDGGAVADFGKLLKQSVTDVAQTENQANQMSAAFERGDPNASLPQVMIAVEKANLSFNALTQVRNKVVQAYQTVMDMAV